MMKHKKTQATIELYLTRGAAPQRQRAIITLNREDAVTQNVSCVGRRMENEAREVAEVRACGLLVDMAQRQADPLCELPA